MMRDFFYWQVEKRSPLNCSKRARRVKMIRFLLLEAEYFHEGVIERTAEALHCSRPSAGDVLL